MRPPFLRSPLLLRTLPLFLLLPAALSRAQDLPDDAMAVLPLDDEFPSLRPEVPRAATQPSTQPSPAAQRLFLLDDPCCARTFLIDHGITPSARLTATYSHNTLGGRDTEGSAFNTLFNLSLALDTEKLAGFPGGTTFFNFQQQHGSSASDEAASLQNVDSTIADGRTQLSEAWYQQAFLDKKLLLKAGKIDAGGDFAFSDFAADFLNSAILVPYTNFLIPTYPDPAFGLDAFAYPSDHLYFAVGAFDGALAQGKHPGENGPHTLFSADAYLIAESGLTWQLTASKLSGRLKLGAWYQTGSLHTFSGGTTDGTWGPYLVLDQKLLRFHPADDNDDTGLGLFLILDHADPALFPAANHLSAGLALKGPFPSRPADTLAFGTTFANLSSDAPDFPHSSETAFELLYKLQLTPYLSLKPDLQYFLHPAFSPSPDALVASLRLELLF